ncbi:MAG: DUF362 domain-containing protein [Thermoanaerobaculia bacterium]
MVASGCPHDGGVPARSRLRVFLRRWFLANSLLAGFFALCWLLLRSGTRPSRFAYPCQQAALSTASLAFGAPVVTAVLALRRGMSAGLRSPAGVASALAGLVVTFGIWGYLTRLEASSVPELPRLEAAADYRARVFHLSACPQDPVQDRFLCIEGLLGLMGNQGLKFHRSTTVTQSAGPDGIIAADDIVIIKINYQWDERGGTNTDVLRGLIRSVVDHPDGFAGEVVVCENAQFASVNGFDRSNNNAQDQTLSPHDVVVHFQGLGYDVSHYDWTVIRTTSVDEYSAGDADDGYVVYPWSSQLNGAVSYPKFQTDYGTNISLRDGIWDPVGASYDHGHLKLINLPVLKSHHATYGVTAAVKNYMGVVTRELGTNSHNSIRNGVLGALLAEIRPADLNILDAIWVNANPNKGPGTNYGDATRRDELVAGTDPVAVDLWATQNILIPAFEANGYYPPWPYPSADPDDPNSQFREYLDNSLHYLLTAGFNATNDPDRIDTFSRAIQISTDGFESGDTSGWTREGNGAP